MANETQPRFLDFQTAQRIANDFGTPVYVYDIATLQANAAEVLAFPNAFGLTARYAMKASECRSARLTDQPQHSRAIQ